MQLYMHYNYCSTQTDNKSNLNHLVLALSIFQQFSYSGPFLIHLVGRDIFSNHKFGLKSNLLFW